MCVMFSVLSMSNRYSEIGSEFWLEGIPETLLKGRNGVYALSGRTAIDLILQDILRRKAVKSVYMPAWCCDSMLAPFLDRGIRVYFYDLWCDERLHYDVDETAVPDIFYLTNYFGYENTLSIEIVDFFKQRGSTILYDRTHSFLMSDEPYTMLADYSFVSIRKWMGVVDGAFVSGLTENPTLKECSYVSIKEEAMQKKFRYLDGDESVIKQEFLNAFGQFGHYLATDYRDYEMDDLSYTLYSREDWAKVKKKRQENASYLHLHLKGSHFLDELTNFAAPLFVPILLSTKEQRDTIRKRLIENQIYCPVHWPKPQQIPVDYRANEIYERELSLICDQRYGVGEMQRIADCINYI